MALLAVELYFPSNQSATERFHGIYKSVTSIPAKGKDGYQVDNYLHCKSGHFYKVGIVPLAFSSIQENEQIVIVKTPIFSKTRAVKSTSETIKILFLFNSLIIYIIVFCLLITIANIFFPNGVLDFILSFASIFLYFLFVAYLVYY